MATTGECRLMVRHCVVAQFREADRTGDSITGLLHIDILMVH